MSFGAGREVRSFLLSHTIMQEIPVSDLEEPPLIADTGLNARIAAIAASVARDLGLRIVRVKISTLNGKTLQIMAERSDGTIVVEDCEALSHALSPVLDVENVVDGAYHLEISSPGIDRPLVRASDFLRAIGFEAKIEMERPCNGRKRFRGFIEGLKESMLLLHLPDHKPDQESRVTLPVSDIAEARLILTDALIRETLRRGGPPQKQNLEPSEEH
jgi:ribosome maturation factor RimP